MDYLRASDFEKLLKCAFCKRRFTGSIKLIDVCGNSICNSCFQDAKEECSQSDIYECLACNIVHRMPNRELPDNKALMHLLSMHRATKNLNPKTKNLQISISDAQEMVFKLQSFDRAAEVNTFCDNLESEIYSKEESEMHTLKKQRDTLLASINQYRQQLLKFALEDSKKPCSLSVNMKSDVMRLDSEVKNFNNKWEEYFTSIELSVGDEEIEKAQKELDGLTERARNIAQRQANQAMDNRRMTFEANKAYPYECLRLGVLTFERDMDKKASEVDMTELRKLEIPKASVGELLFLPNNKLASCLKDNSIRICNYIQGIVVYELKGHSKNVISLALLNNGFLASGSVDTNIIIWDLMDGSIFKKLSGHKDNVFSLLTLPDGNLASRSYDGTIKIWNPNSSPAESSILVTIVEFVLEGNLLSRFLNRISKWPMTNIALLPDGNIVGCLNSLEQTKSSIVCVYSPYDGKCLQSFSFSVPDPKQLIVLTHNLIALSFQNNSIKVLDINEGLVLTIDNKENIHSIARHPNGFIICSDSKSTSTMKVYNPKTGNLVRIVSANQSAAITCMCVSADGKYLASSSEDKTIKIWTLTKKA